MVHQQNQRYALNSARSDDVSLDMGDSYSQDSQGSHGSMTFSSSSSSSPPPSSAGRGSDQQDEAFLLLELGLTEDERKRRELSSRTEKLSISRVKTEEWIDTDEFLWSPNGQ